MCEPSFYSCGIGVGIGIRWIGFDRMWEYNVGIGGERYMLYLNSWNLAYVTFSHYENIEIIFLNEKGLFIFQTVTEPFSFQGNFTLFLPNVWEWIYSQYEQQI